jgi:hypothetical protein
MSPAWKRFVLKVNLPKNVRDQAAWIRGALVQAVPKANELAADALARSPVRAAAAPAGQEKND